MSFLSGESDVGRVRSKTGLTSNVLVVWPETSSPIDSIPLSMSTITEERRAHELDSDAQALLDKLVEEGAPDLSHLSPEQARALLGGLFTPDVEPELVASVEERKIPAYARDIRVRIYDPSPGESLPAAVYFHGGGWVVGDLDTHDGVARSLANEGNFVVVSVDYRCGPEHPFPGAVEDAYLATKWTADNAETKWTADNADEIGAGRGVAVAAKVRAATWLPSSHRWLSKRKSTRRKSSIRCCWIP